MTKQQSKWNADAEAAMMGFTVAVESEEHLTHLVGYVLHTLSGQYHYDEEEKTKEVQRTLLVSTTVIRIRALSGLLATAQCLELA